MRPRELTARALCKRGAKQLQIEKGEPARIARAQLEQLECEAELERLLRVRDALVADGQFARR
jgi:hypothetical protein